MAWGDLTLVLSLRDSRVIPKLKWVVPNGKTVRSKEGPVELEFSDTFGLNAVYWVLVQARRQSAWPDNLELNHLNTEGFTEKMGADTIELPFQKPTEPVFVRHFCGEELPWSCMTNISLHGKAERPPRPPQKGADAYSA